jgi:hypothetical protein
MSSPARSSADEPILPIKALPLSGPERIDGYALLGVGVIGTLSSLDRIDWIAFFVLFWIIDVVGYWPGVIMARIRSGGPVPNLFYHFYCVTHSTAGGLALAAIYGLLAPATAASAFAIAVHLGFDRGILGNRLKRSGEKF